MSLEIQLNSVDTAGVFGMVGKAVREKMTEEALSVVPEAIRKEHIRQVLKNAKSLKDVPLDIRVKEAEKKIYLIRYE